MSIRFYTVAISFFVFILTPIQNVYSGCSMELRETSVARMCYESIASGSDVYIDTSGAKATDNSSGPLCMCNGTIIGAKVVDVDVQGQTKECGSTLSFSSENGIIDFATLIDDCLQTDRSISIVSEMTNFVVELEKQTAPYEVDFCTKVAIRTCADNEFQCKDGSCLPVDLFCNSMPDCPDSEDEEGCQTSCPEGNCIDDKKNKTESIKPQVKIECFESTRFSTTTTTTTTTTTPAPTTTMPTTTPEPTTEPTTTTQEPTTATTPEPTTTEASTSTSAPTTIPIQTSGQWHEAESSSHSMDTTESVKLNTTRPTKDPELNTNDPHTDTGNTEKGHSINWETVKEPYVAASIIGGVILLVGTICLIIWAVRRRKKRSQTQNLSPDLWIQNNQQTELEALNS